MADAPTGLPASLNGWGLDDIQQAGLDDLQTGLSKTACVLYGWCQTLLSDFLVVGDGCLALLPLSKGIADEYRDHGN